jgi:hypothetical protein
MSVASRRWPVAGSGLGVVARQAVEHSADLVRGFAESVGYFGSDVLEILRYEQNRFDLLRGCSGIDDERAAIAHYPPSIAFRNIEPDAHAARRICDVIPNISDRGNWSVTRYTSAVRARLFFQTSRFV